MVATWEVFNGSDNTQKWCVLKTRLKREGNELVIICSQLKCI